MYREYGMWEILEVLRRHLRGESKSQIARATGYHRATVRRYVAVARSLGWTAESGEPDEGLAARVLAQLQPGPREPPPGTLSVEQRLLPHVDELRAWLTPADGSRPLRLTRVQSLLRQRHALTVSYSGLRRFAQAYCAFRRKAITVRMAESAPGEVAEVDFGHLGYVADPASGKRQRLHALIVTLAYSRHLYVFITARQQLADLILGLEHAWEFFGGVPERVILDNLKAAVVRPDRYAPTFQRTFAEYATYRGFLIDAAVPRHPTGKPHVERAVQYVRESFFRGGTWYDAEHVQREVERWCREVAGQRRHGSTRQAPLLIFEQEERSRLRPLTGEPFDPPDWGRSKVHPDHHICFRLGLYSVPTRYVGHEVEVRGDQKLVRIYAKGELIKTHPRVASGKRATDFTDYPPERAPYALRDVDRLREAAHSVGTHAGQFVSRLLAGRLPWAKIRQAQKVLRLAQKYGAPAVDAACARAIFFDLIDVRRLDAIIQLALVRPTPASHTPAPQLPLRFLRSTQSFTDPSQESTKENA